MAKIRVHMNVNWREYRNGFVYDIEDEDDVRELISNGMLTHIPFPESPAASVAAQAGDEGDAADGDGVSTGTDDQSSD